MPVGTYQRNVLLLLFSQSEASEIIRLADKVDTIERKTIRAIDSETSKWIESAVGALTEDRAVPDPKGIDRVLDRLWFETAFAEIKARKKMPSIRMAQSKKKTEAGFPDSMLELRKLWDRWRKGKWRPEHTTERAKKLKKQYLESLHKWWKTDAQPFLSGKVYTQDRVIRKAREDLKMPVARAHTVIRTETTRYQNEVRRQFYDDVDAVTHYLFMTIRDSATTKWCKTRHGMVVEKGTKELDRASPPIHWNCRSELLPLDPDNERHQNLIKDKNRKPSNRRLEPLPKEFRKP